MLGILMEDTALSDIGRQLNGSVIYVNNVPIEVMEVTAPDRFNGREVKEKSHGRVAEYALKPTDEVSLEYPETGYFNHANCCSYFQRIPGRQWAMGYNASKNAKIISPFNAELEELGKRGASRENNAQSIFNRKYYSYTDALKLVGNYTKIACAITKDIAIGRVLDYKQPLLFYKRKVVGYVNDKDVHITILADYILNILPEDMVEHVQFIRD